VVRQLDEMKWRWDALEEGGDLVIEWPSLRVLGDGATRAWRDVAGAPGRSADDIGR
jgi:hypothetical protein